MIIPFFLNFSCFQSYCYEKILIFTVKKKREIEKKKRKHIFIYNLRVINFKGITLPLILNFDLFLNPNYFDLF